MPANTTATSKANILLVQSAQTQGNGTRRYLERAGYRVLWAGSGISALMIARDHRVDLILLDFALPDIEGSDLCARFRSRDHTRNLPIILLTARGSAPESFSRPPEGPDDYLAKPYTESELDARITSVLRAASAREAKRTETSPARPSAAEASSVRPGPAPVSAPRETKTAGGAQLAQLSAPSVPAAPGRPSRTALPRAAEHTAAQPAADEVTDAATGLFSRRQFMAMFSKEFKRSLRFKQHMSCMLIDLDGSVAGRSADAKLVKDVIGLVQRTIREVDTAAVWTGDAFIVLLPNTIRNDAMQAGMRVLEAVAEHPFSWPDATRVTMSIGVAGMPDPAIDTEQKMLEAAQAACDRARTWAKK